MSKIECSNGKLSVEQLTKLSRSLLNTELYLINYSNYNHLISNFLEYLNATELQRAKRYHFDKDRKNFIIRRTLLKCILAHQTSCNILDINLKEDDGKKPFLQSSKSIFFNVSHSKNNAVIAISNQPIGIDIEFLNKDFDFSAILPHSFNKSEIEQIYNAANKTNTFFTFWTRKEAIVKATGKGITDELTQIIVTDGSNYISDNLIDDLEHISVISFNLQNDYIVSVAYGNHINKKEEDIFYQLPADMTSFLF